MTLIHKITILAISLTAQMGLFAQSAPEIPAIDFGAKITGKFSGGDKADDVFLKIPDNSEWSYWSLSQTFFRIRLNQLLKSIQTPASASQVIIAGNIYFTTTAGQRISIRTFKEAVTFKSLEMHGKQVKAFKPNTLYISVPNDDSLKNRDKRGRFDSLVLEITSPIQIKHSIQQPQDWGGE